MLYTSDVKLTKKVLYKLRLALQNILKVFNLRIVRYQRHLDLVKLNDKYLVLNKWTNYRKNSEITLENFIISNTYQLPKYSQLQQDLVAEYIASVNQKQERFFVEFGASDGITYSNTFLLEKFFGWKGLLAEPGKKWHDQLLENRTSTIEKRCVWSHSGHSLEFAESREGEYSTIKEFMSSDLHENQRLKSKIYNVPTISLNDLLTEHKVPKNINYLSIDTEGSEFDILRTFHIEKYEIDFITIEHNYTKNRDSIYEYLTNNGFLRILEDMSEWDDWYIHQSLAKKFL